MKLHQWQDKLATDKALKVAEASIKAGASPENALRAGEKAFEEIDAC